MPAVQLARRQVARQLAGLFPLALRPSSPPRFEVVNIGADMPRWTSRNIRGEPWQGGRSSNRPDLATKRHPGSRSWLVGGGLSPWRTVAVIGHGLFQAAYPKVRKFQVLQNYPVEVVREPKWEDSVLCLALPSLLGGPPDASYTPSACSSKPGLPQIRFDMVRWRRLETSKPPPSRQLDEHIAGSVPIVDTGDGPRRSIPGPLLVSIPLTDCSWEKDTLGAKTARPGMLPDLTTQVL